MNALRAIWTNGRILPSEPVDWPEGSQLRVEPLSPPHEKIGMSEDEWRDDPDSIAAWIEEVESIEPLIWAKVRKRSLNAGVKSAANSTSKRFASKWKPCPKVTRHETSLPLGHGHCSRLSSQLR